MDRNLQSKTHRRRNILTGEWILVSPGRLKRPWLGKVERVSATVLPTYDPGCYLCPGNERANGEKNPDYQNTFVFDNDFSALSHETTKINVDGLIQAESESGICRVVCFSPRHHLTLAEMDERQIAGVVEVWRSEYISLGKLDDVNYVQIFENKGELMGCSNPHPHCQIWAESSIPVEPSKESRNFEEFRRRTGRCIICDYIALELEQKDRVVFETDRFVAVVPFWAVWPFEVLIAPKKHQASLAEFNGDDNEDFASALKKITVRYDNLFETSFPYSSGIHQSPTDAVNHPEWHLHMHFYPPLLRSASVKKFMVGYEMLANPQRDITAEAAAERLREMSEVHYENRENR
ncbi:MAG TPA: UDP-glucose--hexose-1-phosphate uridylyltransferase [Candidatus Acidoferrales bacterium]|nr:UDP-glucose--hexose-1-phosphate uridylyltransferase [Candidatus Acidoferrales bacterium]